MNLNFLHDILIRGTRLNNKEIILNSSFALVSWLETSPDLEQISHPLHVSAILLANWNGNVLLVIVHIQWKDWRLASNHFQLAGQLRMVENLLDQMLSYIRCLSCSEPFLQTALNMESRVKAEKIETRQGRSSWTDNEARQRLDKNQCCNCQRIPLDQSFCFPESHKLSCIPDLSFSYWSWDCFLFQSGIVQLFFFFFCYI